MPASGGTTEASRDEEFRWWPLLWVTAILAGAIQAAAGLPGFSSDDAIAYLDVADAYLSGYWSDAVNGYFSPVYSWLLAVPVALVKPSGASELAVVRFVNFLQFGLALACFTFFWRQVAAFQRSAARRVATFEAFSIPDWVWALSGSILFLWSTLIWTPTYSDTPDLTSAGFLYLAAGIALRMRMSGPTALGFAVLGAVCGLAYLSKTIMLPVTVVLLAGSGQAVIADRRRWAQFALGIATLAVVALPFVAVVSLKKGRFTFGDTGQLNYGWYVSPGVRPRQMLNSAAYWQGDVAWGRPVHPPNVLARDPDVFEFARPVIGTYPLWSDPSYWFEGAAVTFDFRRQVRVLQRNLSFFWDMFLGPTLFVSILLAMVGGLGRFLRGAFESWILFVPAGAGLAAYAFGTTLQAANAGAFQSSMRLVAPFAVLLVAALISSIRLTRGVAARQLVNGLTVAAAAVLGSQLVAQVALDIRGAMSRRGSPQWDVARAAGDLGIRSGDPVAILGAFENSQHHWARLARARIVAEVPNQTRFWQAEASVRAQVVAKIGVVGAKAIIQSPRARGEPESADEPGWQRLGTTGYSIYFLR